MQRLVLAIIVLVVLVALLAAGLAVLRRMLAPGEAQSQPADEMPQKVAFMLLAALIVYVSTTGAP
ncbi:MAG: hypothetical protein AAGJ74_09225 [Pseudomonadota bacterium]